MFYSPHKPVNTTHYGLIKTILRILRGGASKS